MGTVNKFDPILYYKSSRCYGLLKLIKQSEKIQMQIIQSNALMMTVKRKYFIRILLHIQFRMVDCKHVNSMKELY